MPAKKNTQPRKVARAASGKGSQAKRKTVGPSAAPATPHEVVSTPSTPSPEIRLVEGVERQPSTPTYDWYKDTPLHENFRTVGAGMRRLAPNLFHHPDGGLVLVEGGRPRRTKAAKELSPLLRKVKDIIVRKPLRKDLGDLRGLAAGIKE